MHRDNTFRGAKLEPAKVSRVVDDLSIDIAALFPIADLPASHRIIVKDYFSTRMSTDNDFKPGQFLKVHKSVGVCGGMEGEYFIPLPQPTPGNAEKPVRVVPLTPTKPWTGRRPTRRCAPPAAAAGGVRRATPELRSASASPAAPPIPNARAGGPFFCSRDVAQSVLQHVARARDLADDVCDRSPMPFRPDVFRVADVRRQEESLQGAMWSR
jgi:hypothetical protein